MQLANLSCTQYVYEVFFLVIKQKAIINQQTDDWMNEQTKDSNIWPILQNGGSTDARARTHTLLTAIQVSYDFPVSINKQTKPHNCQAFFICTKQVYMI